MEAAPLTAESFSAWALFLRADWVVKGVMIGLALASLWSWTIILDKLFRFAALNRQADRFEDAVSSGSSLEEVDAKAGEQPKHPLPRMLRVALREWKGAKDVAPSASRRAPGVQRIDRALTASSPREPAGGGRAGLARHRGPPALRRAFRHGVGDHERLPGHRRWSATPT